MRYMYATSKRIFSTQDILEEDYAIEKNIEGKSGIALYEQFLLFCQLTESFHEFL